MVRFCWDGQVCITFRWLTTDMCAAKELEDLFERLPEPYGELSSYQRIQITSAPDEIDRETREFCDLIRKCMAMRKKWVAVNEVSAFVSISVHLLGCLSCLQCLV